MTNQTKRGFSLVEIMILFTVMAVAMAATLPVITKKSHPVPRKVTHGVYRCYATADGGYMEETYNSFRLLKGTKINPVPEGTEVNPEEENDYAFDPVTNPTGKTCDFKIPKASVYKIDLYAAGAGGTKYAAYKPLNDDTRQASFTMDDAKNYASGKDAKPKFRAGKDMPYTITNGDILWAFTGIAETEPYMTSLSENTERVVLTAHTANAGVGGSAKFKYSSPASAVCSALIDNTGKSFYTQKKNTKWNEYQAAITAYNNAIKAYNDEVKKYTDMINNLEKKAGEYEGYITTNNAVITTLDGYSKTLDDVEKELKQLREEYITLFTTSTTTPAKRAELYPDIKRIASKNLAAFGIDAIDTGLRPVTYRNGNGDQSTYTASYNYNTMKKRIEDDGSPSGTASMNEKMQYIDNWINDDSKHMETEYDEEGNVTGSHVKSDVDRINDLYTTSTYKLHLTLLKGYANIYTSSSSYTTIPTIRTYLKNAKNNVTGANTTLTNKIQNINEGSEDTPGTIPYVKKQQKLSEQSGKLKELQNKIDEAYIDLCGNGDECTGGKTGEYNTAKAHYDQFLIDSDDANKGANAKVRPVQYNNKSKMYDTNNYVQSQFDAYCREVYADYYAEKFPDMNVSTFQQDGSDEQNVSQSGGAAGKKGYLQLVYYLNYNFSDYQKYNSKAFYKTDAEYEKFSEYPYIKYIGDLYGNINNHGFAVAACTRNTNLSSSVCTSGETPSKGDDGKNIETRDPKHNLIKVVDGTRHVFTNDELDKDSTYKGDGKKVPKYLAYHIPNYQSYDTAGKFVTIEKTVAKGGKKAAVGYIDSGLTYNEGDLSTDLAWSTFEGAKPDNGDDATFGESSTVSDVPAKKENRYEVKKVDSEYAQEPKFTMEANLWSKKYGLGQAGTKGEHVHLRTTSMGTSCKIIIPHAGPTFDYYAMLREAEKKGISSDNIDFFMTSKAKEYEDKLNASMVCIDESHKYKGKEGEVKKNNVVISLIAKGGKYNTSISGIWANTNPFYWKKSAKENESVQHKANNNSTSYKSNYSGVASKWAKIFHTNAMKPLTGYNISNGGSYTGLTDKCTAPKGKMNVFVYRMISNGITWSVGNSGNPIRENDRLPFAGKISGVDCYRDDIGPYDDKSPRTMGTRILDPDKLSDTEKELYDIKSPSPAGGGAIVITW